MTEGEELLIYKYGKLAYSHDANDVCNRCAYSFHWNNPVCQYCLHNIGEHYYYSTDKPDLTNDEDVEAVLDLIKHLVSPKRLELIKEALHKRIENERE